MQGERVQSRIDILLDEAETGETLPAGGGEED